MKIRNHKQFEYHFYSNENSTLKDRAFKTKKKLMNYLNGNFPHSLNGSVHLYENSFGGRSQANKIWFVWYNDIKGAKPNILLKKRDFGFKKNILSKEDKKYHAFSDKIFHKMILIHKNNNIKTNAKKLVDLFYKSGFKDFEPDEDELNYINGHISSGIDFYHWSDRCDFLRMKVILEYFKRKELL